MKGRKENVNLRVMISYDNKGFILALVLQRGFSFPGHIFSLQLKFSFSVYADHRSTEHRKHHLLALLTLQLCLLNEIFTIKFRNFHKIVFFSISYLNVCLLIFSHLFSQHFRIIPAAYSIVNYLEVFY